MKYFYILILSVLYSCKNEAKTDILSFRSGHFKTYLGKRKDSSFVYRNDRLQVERYKNKKDSFNIEWKNNFEYQLKKINPKNKLDSIPFIVKITAIKPNSYNFKAYYLGSNFKQKGTTIRLNK